MFGENCYSLWKKKGYNKEGERERDFLSADLSFLLLICLFDPALNFLYIYMIYIKYDQHDKKLNMIKHDNKIYIFIQ